MSGRPAGLKRRVSVVDLCDSDDDESGGVVSAPVEPSVSGLLKRSREDEQPPQQQQQQQQQQKRQLAAGASNVAVINHSPPRKRLNAGTAAQSCNATRTVDIVCLDSDDEDEEDVLSTLKLSSSSPQPAAMITEPKPRPPPPRRKNTVEPDECIIVHTRIDHLAGNYNEGAVSLENLLKRPDINRAVLFSFMVDLDFVMRQCHSNLLRDPRNITIMHGHEHPGDMNILNLQRLNYPGVRLIFPTKKPLPYGCHHTKAMFLSFDDDTLQVVISTGNLVPADYTYMSNMLFITPRLKMKSPSSPQDSRFELDLTSYIGEYGAALEPLTARIRKHDFSGIDAILVGSIPGSHKGDELHKFGHMRLRTVLSETVIDEDGDREKDDNTDNTINDERSDMMRALAPPLPFQSHNPLRSGFARAGANDGGDKDLIVCQSSSIGSLGAKGDGAWLFNEFGTSLRQLRHRDQAGESINHVGKNPAAQNQTQQRQLQAESKIAIVYPTVNDILGSTYGEASGNTIMLSYASYIKQRAIMKPICHRWHSRHLGRSRVMPHVKTYVRFSSPSTSAVHHSQLQPGQMEKKPVWFLMTSANLSQAAWGSLNGAGTSLKISSYELGVLVHGKMLERVTPPYDFPLTPYGEHDECWTTDFGRSSR